MLEKMEMGKNSKECFVEMSKYGKMQDRLRSEMRQLNSPKLQKIMEELKNRNGKATFHEITEYNGFKGTFEGIIFSFAYAPLDYSLILEKTHILQFLHNCLRHFTFAPARREICNCFILDLGLVLFGSHLCVTSSDSGAMKGVSGCHKQLENAILNLTAARSQDDKNPRSYCTGLYGL